MNSPNDYNTNQFKVHEWRRIPGAESYLVSSDGRVASLRTGRMRLLKPWLTREKYLQVDLGGSKKYVHRLVALTFHGEPPPGDFVVHHGNHERDCNLASNLEYLSRAENSRRRLNTSRQ